MRNSGGGANHNAQRGNRMGLHINLKGGQHSHTAWNQVRKSCPRPHLRSLTLGLLCWPLMIGCVENPLAPESQQADAQACFMRAMSYCREVGPSCIDAELRACDEALARNAPPITEGLSAKLISCFEENQGATEQSPSTDWRRCLHMLEAE